MSFFAILLALLLEQARPLAPGNLIHKGTRDWVRWVTRNFDTGQPNQAWLVWFVSVGVPALGAALVHWLLAFFLGWFAAMLWSAAVLYVTLGFRQFSHHFTGIRDALDAGDEALARRLLAQWRHGELAELSQREILRQVIEVSVVQAHRHVFGVLVWFVLLTVLWLGPAGAVLYRLSEFVAREGLRRQGVPEQAVSPHACEAAAQAWAWVDWLPVRATALGFAVVGSFEDAIDGWRQYMTQPEANNDGLLLAATAGALNVQLQTVLLQGDDAAVGTLRPQPQTAHLRSAVGLVWRSVVMWMVLLALLSLAHLLG